MIVTLTPDPVLDRVITIPAWTPGEPTWAESLTLSVGGKGLDASVALACLGVETTGLCFLAGAAGRELLALLERYRIQLAPVWVEGETRTAHIVAERQRQRHTHLFSGGVQVTPAQQESLWQAMEQALPGAGWLISGGPFPASLPGDYFAELTRRAHRLGVPVLLDTRSRYLLPALAEKPEIVKMNQQEFRQTFDFSPADLPALVEAAPRLRTAHGIQSLVVTCGAAGMWAWTPQGAFHARPPVQAVVSAAGAGDAASGALAWRFSLGESWPEALRWAAAASAAAVLTTGTGELHPEELERIMPEVVVTKLFV